MKIFNALIAAALASGNSYDYDFTDVFQAHDFVTKTAAVKFGNFSFKKRRSKYHNNSPFKNVLFLRHPKCWIIFMSFLAGRVLTKNLAGKITAASKRALSNNPGSSGGLKRKCAKSQAISVSNETVQIMKNLADDGKNANFRDAMVSFEISQVKLKSIDNDQYGPHYGPF